MKDFKASLDIREDIFQVVVEMAANNSEHVDENWRAEGKRESRQNVWQIWCLKVKLIEIKEESRLTWKFITPKKVMRM